VQGGDCAETLADCRSPVIADKLKILLQMSLVMVHEGKRPVVRVGRFAGQYAKPRSKPVESREGVVRPSYFGDMVNRADFTEDGRRPDPENMIAAYSHAAMTLNFVRSLSAGASPTCTTPSTGSCRSSASERPRLPRGVREDDASWPRRCRFMEALGERASKS
jgi:3-deoxy-7-phosphoheptulonate synthase